MSSTLTLAVGLVASAFVAVNVGGSSMGVAFGPVTGSDAVGYRLAAVLMGLSVAVGGVALGGRVTETLGEEFVAPSVFTVEAALVVLGVTGVGILVGNYRRISVSTSATAVGAVTGLGLAADALRWGTVARIGGSWVAAAVVAFWVAAVLGRYRYERIAAALRGHPRRARLALVAGGCAMGAAAGGSNVANAVGALVGADLLRMGPATLVGVVGIALGAAVLGPRTLETVGEGITELSVAGALIVQAVAATIITLLNVAAVPASLAITTTMSVVGLGWGRASRVADGGERDERGPEETAESTPAGAALYDPDVTRRIVVTWVATPAVACGLAVAAVVALG
ncbi:anion permease [Halosimplex aquaticum]|uniref:Anion permease n=1 Tax=Halosimplex aquaticum TaxID=3026162 RepID=A0ABD5XYE8_9EURY|nr:inorganic phosphate transporter [Halosimplex aquaticum]